jgi:putative ABC transport system substrate-binding protein
MRRRDFIALTGGAALAPLVALAQQADRMRRVGILIGSDVDDPEFRARIAAFLQGLAQLGWADGRNVRIDTRWATTNPDAIRRHATELAALAPEVILAATGTATVAPLLQATRIVPIVFTVVIDPVGAGFVASLARPGGNATGFTIFEYGMSGKWLELLKEIAPGVKRAAVLRDPAIARSGNGGLIVTGSALAARHRDLIIALAARHKLPAVYSGRWFVADGGLLSYGPDYLDQYRRAAGYVDRILKGEKPADMPVQAPTGYELVINLKTAKALGLDVPASMLARVNEVIE